MTAELRPPFPSMTQRIDTALSVSDLVARARRAVETALPLLWVSGEISGLRRAASGHHYFSLKDEAAQVSCVLYRQKVARVPAQLRDGMAIEARVLATFYAPRGEFQLQVEEVRLAGVGALYEAFARLKAKLEAEGLFDAARKRALPAFPKRVGLITSRTGAVLHDMATTLAARWPAAEIILYPSVVQGEGAPAALVAALQAANTRQEADVLIIGRGGGSMEDLWAFNDEALAREIANSAIPIVSAVGHETDFTIADFVADVRAPTPTYAASMVVPDAYEWAQRLDGALSALQSFQRFRLQKFAQRLRVLEAKLRHPRVQLALDRQRLSAAAQRFARCKILQIPAVKLSMLSTRLTAARPDMVHARLRLSNASTALQNAVHLANRGARQNVKNFEQALSLLAPERVLARGYAWVTREQGGVVSAAAALKRGERVRIALKDGEVKAEIIETAGGQNLPLF